MRFTIFDRYVFKNLAVSSFLICSVLTLLIMLVQSIRFLELVMNSGANLSAFGWLLTLSVPRFVEAVLPISLMVSILFFYNKIIMDSEVVIMRSAGASQLSLIKPVLALSFAMMLVLFTISVWIAPTAISNIQLLRQDIKAQYSSLLFREGIFNTVGSGLTAYIRSRDQDGLLRGLMIHDARDVAEGGNAYTVVAKSGVAISDANGQKVIVYNGTRHELNEARQTLSRLDFEQYTIDIPDIQDDISTRWKEPDERTLTELLDFDSLPDADHQHIPQFIGEANRRLSLPFLLLAFCLISTSFLLIGAIDRRGLSKRIAAAAVSVLALQGAYLFVFNLTKQNFWANGLLYILPISVIILCLLLLSPFGEKYRRLFFPSNGKNQTASQIEGSPSATNSEHITSQKDTL